MGTAEVPSILVGGLFSAGRVIDPDFPELSIIRSTAQESSDMIGPRVEIGKTEEHLRPRRAWIAIEIVVLHDMGNNDAIVDHIHSFVSGIIAGHPDRCAPALRCC